jgi:hypothetical protein
MPTTAAALEILLILLPGFAAAYFVQLLAVRAKQTDLEKLIEALLFSFLIYVSYAFLRGTDTPIHFLHLPAGDEIQVQRLNLLLVAGLTVGYALLMVLYVNKDGARFFRRVGLTERTSRNSIWNDIFQDVQQTVDPHAGSIVQVETEDGRSVTGVLHYYSDSADECSVFLRQAEWVGEDGELVPIHGPGILLTQNAKITSISFLDPPPEDKEGDA